MLLPIAVNVALFMIGASLILSIWRLLIGPSLPDRVICLDLIATLVVGMIAVYAIASDQAVFLRDAIVLAVVSFLGTVAFAYYVGKGGMP